MRAHYQPPLRVLILCISFIVLLTLSCKNQESEKQPDTENKQESEQVVIGAEQLFNSNFFALVKGNGWGCSPIIPACFPMANMLSIC